MSTGVDAHSNPMTGGVDAIELYDRAMDRLVRYHPEAVDLAGELNSDDAAVPMASALLAYLHLMSTDLDDLATARTAWQALSQSDGNEREKAHSEAIGAWLRGDWYAAASLLDELLLRWPTDLLALMIGHQLDFFLGNAQNLRDRPIRSLREFAPDDPHAAFVRGMAAFGLEESGHYGQALDTGLAAVAANPDDVWGIHAVVHTYEMQGLVDEGIQFLASDATRWEAGQHVHGAQLVAPGALYNLEAGRPQAALRDLRQPRSTTAVRQVSRSRCSMPARCCGACCSTASTPVTVHALAEAWAPKVAGEPWYAFNDFHGMLALAGADRRDDISTCHRIAAALARRGHRGLERAHDRGDRPPRMPCGAGVRRRSARRRDRGVDADPWLVPTLRRVARAARRAAANTSRIGVAGRSVRLGSSADRRTPRSARVERVQLEPAVTCPGRTRAVVRRRRSPRSVPQTFRDRFAIASTGRFGTNLTW